MSRLSAASRFYFTYPSLCWVNAPTNAPSNITQYSVIGFEGLIQSDTAEFVHHLVVTGWSDTPDCWQTCDRWFIENFGSSESGSYSSSSPTPSPSHSSGGPSSSSSRSYTSATATYFESQNITLPSFCTSDADIFPWAPGASNVELPVDLGFAFGNASGGITSVSIETHYDNPEGIEGMVDSSGVRVYYSEEPRPIEMGVSPFPSARSTDFLLQCCTRSTLLSSPGRCVVKSAVSTSIGNEITGINSSIVDQALTMV